MRVSRVSRSGTSHSREKHRGRTQELKKKHKKKNKELTQYAVTVTQHTVATTQYARKGTEPLKTVTVAVYFHSGHRRDHSEAVAQA
jgi:ribosomal protein S25